MASQRVRWFRCEHADWRNDASYARRVKEGGPGAERLDSVLDSLEQAGWRDLFALGVAPSSPEDVLGLLVRGDECLLIAAQAAVYALRADGILDLVGACDRTMYPDQYFAVHAYDESG